MKKYYFLIFLALFLSFPGKGEAEIVVYPSVISGEGSVRDGFDFTINVKNEGQRRTRLYPLVKDVSVEEGRILREKNPLEQESFLSSWINIRRSRMDINPEEEEELQLTVRIDNDAEPGKYYAVVVFARGSTEDEARRNAVRFNYPETLINIDVKEDIVERMQLINFRSDKESFYDSAVDFSLMVENIGNRELKPYGSVIIYKSRHGKELDSLPINEKGLFVEAGKKETFEISWDAKGGFGQYKAVLIGEYGEEARRDIQDTIYFWIIPREFLIFSGVGLFLLIFFLFSFSRKKKNKKAPVYRSTVTTLDLSSKK